MAGVILTGKQTSITESTCQDRRKLLKLGMTAAGIFAVPNAFAAAVKQPERSLALHNLHTGEHIKATYWAEGIYQPEELHRINYVLRDHRTGDVDDIDENLIELLNLLHHKMDAKKPFQVISGYRSPKTNAMLRNNSSGVAKKSLHMLGQAIDIRLPDKHLKDLHAMARSLKLGGVGYYPKSNFIHVDTGRVRHWAG